MFAQFLTDFVGRFGNFVFLSAEIFQSCIGLKGEGGGQFITSYCAQWKGVRIVDAKWETAVTSSVYNVYKVFFLYGNFILDLPYIFKKFSAI